MASSSHLHPVVAAQKERLLAGRDRLRRQHDSGSPGVQVCAMLTDLLDSVLLELYASALQELGDRAARRLDNAVVLTAHGGYGRRDVAPFSDVDLMLLHEAGMDQEAAPLARRLTYSLYDLGLQLGFSVRTPSQACALAMKDATIFTSLVEARRLAGSERLMARFTTRFRRAAARRFRPLLARVVRAREDERRQYGDTVYLLSPNVKRSKGALRDIQLARWVGFARYGAAEPESLSRAGVMTVEDRRRLERAREFLLRLRNELHFHAGRQHDVLDKDEQLRIAEQFRYKAEEGLLPVEQFMREYFHHTGEVRDAVLPFVATARSRPLAAALLRPLLTHQVEGDFRVGPVHISATRRGLEKLRGDLAQVLRLMDLANLYDKRIEHATWVAIRQDMMQHRSIEVSPEAAERFLSLLSQGACLADLLRQLHQLRVLEKLVCGMDHARSLMQFNEYHKYTVDEHSIRAVQHATELRRDPGPVGEAYRAIHQKRTLHLALLLHDLGKGWPGDHSLRGAELAAQTAARLGLPARETDTLRFLVLKHLRMSHVAFRHDLHDESLIVGFAAEVGSPDVLRLLYVLAYCDLSAVGPGVMNDWKLELLTDLYSRTTSYLTDDSPLERAEQRRSGRRQELRQQVTSAEDAAWWDQQIQTLPPGYLFGAASEHILEQLDRLRQTPRHKAVAWGRFLPERKVVQYTVGAHESITPGIFHRLTGVLASQGQQILSAEIYTLPDQIVLDQFCVHDGDYSGRPPDDRLNDLSRRLVAALESPTDDAPSFRRVWKSSSAGSVNLSSLPTHVRWDNDSSEKLTIFIIFAYDRMGLLYAISRTLYQLGLSVHVAKIATHLDQVVDVFYVTDEHGQKVLDEQRFAYIRERLIDAIEQRDQGDTRD